MTSSADICCVRISAAICTPDKPIILLFRIHPPNKCKISMTQAPALLFKRSTDSGQVKRCFASSSDWCDLRAPHSTMAGVLDSAIESVLASGVWALNKGARRDQVLDICAGVTQFEQNITGMLALHGNSSVRSKDPVIDAISSGGDLLRSGGTGHFLGQLSSCGLA